MKVEEVPQDNRYIGNSPLRDLYYALDDNGHYRQVPSLGWSAKNEALSLTWESISDAAEAVRRDVLQGLKSPLAYHMELHLLPPAMLAAYSGISQKTIKKHLKPDAFARLDDHVLQQYAAVLNITVEELKTV
jgi:hypothetical protein